MKKYTEDLEYKTKLTSNGYIKPEVIVAEAVGFSIIGGIIGACVSVPIGCSIIEDAGNSLYAHYLASNEAIATTRDFLLGGASIAGLGSLVKDVSKNINQFIKRKKSKKNF